MGNFSVTLSFASLIFLTIILVIFLLKKNSPNFEVKIFSRLLIITIIGLLIDIIGYFTFKFLPDESIINSFIARCYIIYYFLWGFNFTTYVVCISLEKFYTRFKKLFSIIAIVISLILFVLPIYVYNDGVSSYSYGVSVK